MKKRTKTLLERVAIYPIVVNGKRTWVWATSKKNAQEWVTILEKEEKGKGE
jgi:hypothetical protein